MRIRRFLPAGLIVGLLLLVLRLPATSVQPPELDSLVRQSDYVVRAVVKSATPEWRENAGRRYISTRVELEVREVIKGSPPVPLVLDLMGGRIGEDEMVVTGMPRFQVGDESVLFVHGKQRKMLPLVALMHGVYPVVRETRTGQDYVLRSNGQPLYSAQEVALPMDQASTFKRQNPQARPLTAGAFATQIRQRAVDQPTQRER
jgi:hypothetical protein